jgi:LacI family transcriptional regulator
METVKQEAVYHMNAKKVTIYDIARAAGVSVGTVNRALSGKDRISPATKKLVLDTADRLGYRANSAAQGLRRAPITIGAVLFCPVDEYVDTIIDGMRATAQTLEKYNVTVDIRKLDYTDSTECLARTEALIRSFADAQYRGVILFLSSMLDELDGIRALIDEYSEAGICFATVANDIPDSARVVHVGVDAHTAGSMAAEMLEMTCAGGDVALLVASKKSPVNRQYIDGFTDYAKDSAFSDIKIYEHLDDPARVMAVTEQLLCENPNLRGIYMATASSVISCDCIRRHGRHDLAIITTDLLCETPSMLKERLSTAAIFQNPYRQGKNVLRYLFDYITRASGEHVHLIAPHILLASNVDAHLSEENL